MTRPAFLTALDARLRHELDNASTNQSASHHFGHLHIQGLETLLAHLARRERMSTECFAEGLGDRFGDEMGLGVIPQPQSDFASALEAACSHESADWAELEHGRRPFDLAQRENELAMEILLAAYISEKIRATAEACRMEEFDTIYRRAISVPSHP